LRYFSGNFILKRGFVGFGDTLLGI